MHEMRPIDRMQVRVSQCMQEEEEEEIVRVVIFIYWHRVALFGGGFVDIVMVLVGYSNGHLW